MIEAAADKFYDDIVNKIINPTFVSRKAFVRKMTRQYKKIVGESFKSFMKTHKKVGNVYEDILEILKFLEPTGTMSVWDDDWYESFHNYGKRFVYTPLHQMAIDEGYFTEEEDEEEDDDIGNLISKFENFEEYLDSIGMLD